MLSAVKAIACRPTVVTMSESDSNVGSRLPSSCDSEIHQACPAYLSSHGSEQTVATPITTSSSEPPSVSPGRPLPVALQGASPAPNTVRNSDSSAAPDTVRSGSGADAELERLLKAQARAAPYGPYRERSRDRGVAQNYAISTPTGSRAATPSRRTSPRVNPVTPTLPGRSGE